MDMSDKEATLFNIAGQLHHIFSNDSSLEHPLVVGALGDFLVRVVMSPSRRTVISPAETYYLLHQWSGYDAQAPRTFNATVHFLRAWWLYIAKVEIHPHVRAMWELGYLFFGSVHVVRTAMHQLGIEAKGHVVVSASNAFFRRAIAQKTTRHLSYSVFLSSRAEVVPTKAVMLYARWPVLCAQPGRKLNFSELFTKINQQ